MFLSFKQVLDYSNPDIIIKTINKIDITSFVAINNTKLCMDLLSRLIHIKNLSNNILKKNSKQWKKKPYILLSNWWELKIYIIEIIEKNRCCDGNVSLEPKQELFLEIYWKVKKKEVCCKGIPNCFFLLLSSFVPVCYIFGELI